MNSYSKTLDYLYQQLPMFHRIGPAAFKKDLTNTIDFCAHLGNPQDKFKSVHIAGTNGKGSVAHFLAAIFAACGMKTGLYTSPHYRDFRERIRINGNLIPKKEVVNFVQANRHVSEWIKPSFFEWTVALAFDYFAKEQVDIAIIETGMGGRLDSTNILRPLLSIVTNISFDHQQFLGNTLPLIAAEKAGIIKPGVPVVIGETQEETKSVFLLKAQTCGSKIYFADQHYKAEIEEETLSGYRYRITTKTGLHWSLVLSHRGAFQSLNLVTTLKAADLLRSFTGKTKREFRLYLQEGLSNLKGLTGFQGRWEVFDGPPKIILDSAHNESGLKLAMDRLSQLSFKKLHIVFGTVSDKSLERVFPLLPQMARYYFAKANIPRGKNALQLQTEAAAFGLSGKAYTSVRKALAAAKMCASVNDLIFVGGSIFVVAEVI